MDVFLKRTIEYHRYHQTVPGWYNLVTAFANTMFMTASERDCYAFMRYAGENFAREFSLSPSATIGEMEINVNVLMHKWNWGQVDIQPEGASIKIIHYALPKFDGTISESRWIKILSELFIGIYSVWLREQGAHEKITLMCETFSAERLVFRYHK